MHIPIFKNFNEALLNCSGRGYSEAELVNTIIIKTINFKNTIRSDITWDLRYLRAIFAVMFALQEKSLSVIDFGGSAGLHYFICRHLLSNDIALDWNVIETESMCQACLRSELSLSTELKFFDSVGSFMDATRISRDSRQVDLVFSSSALQYTPDPLACLHDLISVGASSICLTRTPFSHLNRTIFSIQQSNLADNGPGPLPAGCSDQKILYPISYLPLDFCINTLKSFYDIRLKVAEDPPSIFCDGVPVNQYYGILCSKLP